MAPVVRVAELPELQAMHIEPAEHPAGVLLCTGMQALLAAAHRRGLGDADLRVGFHQVDQLRQAAAGHDAVGVEHHHVAEGTAPAAAEVGDIAGLAAAAAPAPAVVHRRQTVLACLRGQTLPGLLLVGQQPRVAGVRQHEELEARAAPGARQRLGGGAQAGEDRLHILVADRHDDGGACGRVGHTVGADRQRLRITRQQPAPAHQRGHEAGRDPGEQQRQQRRAGQLGQTHLGRRAMRPLQAQRQQRDRQHGQAERAAPALRRSLPGRRRAEVAGRAGQPLEPAAPALPRLRRHVAAHQRRHDGCPEVLCHRFCSPSGGSARLQVSVSTSRPCIR